MRLVVAALLLALVGRAQIDSAITIPLVGLHFGGCIPSADMAQRFGPNLQAGGSVLLKTKRNWVVGIDFNYMFGRNVKEHVLTQLTNADGFVVDNEGFPADLRVSERAMMFHAQFGRLFRLASLNPNSGLIVTVGAGYMYDKIMLYDSQKKVAALKGDLIHGYDRLSDGFSLSQFVGYLFLSENRMLNFYAGFECFQGFTSSVRKVNYDTGLPDTKKRLDVLTGFRIGWILPLYKKRPNDFYYD